MTTLYGANVVRDGLVLHLDAANVKSYPGSGTNVFDLSNYKTNSIVYQAVSNDNYFEFDGTDDNLYISSLATNANQIYSITNIVSIDAAIYPYSIGGDSGPAIIRCGLGTDLTFAVLINTTQKTIIFHWYDGAFKSSTSPLNALTFDSWNLISVVRDSSSVSFYVNGIHLSTNTGLTDPTPVPSNLGIGASRAGTSVGTTAQDFSGRISYIKIYNRALSTLDVKQNFEALRGRYGI